MSYRRLFLACPLVLMLATLLIAAVPQADNWKGVEEAIAQGLPKTAIERLNPIILRAVAEKKYGEAIKAIGTKISLEGSVQGGKPEEQVARMKAAVADAPPEMKPVMETLLANWYWQYFQDNRWRFMNRTATEAPPSDDFETWDLPRILSEVELHFDASLADADRLQRIPIADYDDLLEKGNVPDSYQPTLYDFLGRKAFDFYSAGEQVGSRHQDAFDLSADSPIFSSNDDFLNWQPASKETDSPTLKAIQLLQSMAKFHRQDDDDSALLDLELLRLNFGHDFAFGEEKDDRYKAALRRFIREHDDQPISARASHDLARQLHEEENWAESHRVAGEAMNEYPESVGGRRCFNLTQQIEAKEAMAVAERVWNEAGPKIEVTYRNVEKIHFRLYPLSFDTFLRSGRWRPEQMDDVERRRLLSEQPVKAWSADLPSTDDFRARRQELDAPLDVPAGGYLLVASCDAEFGEAENQISVSEVWISDLAIVTREGSGDGVVEGFVLDAISGEPIEGAEVTAWTRERSNQLGDPFEVMTDVNGLFRIKARNQQRLQLLVRHDGQSLSLANQLHVTIRPKRNEARSQTRLFTDRSLYRPGQSIMFKGICLVSDVSRDRYETLADRNVTVVLLDPNGKEIQRSDHRTNSRGSFRGSMTAPRGRLTGRMTLRMEGQPAGSTQVSVEEYKRPKFRVTLDPPKSAARLGDKVELFGQATAYTGAAVDGAAVRWRVVREVRFPAWWGWRNWWLPKPSSASQEIARGTAVTGRGGEFQLEFVARPDRQVAPESEPTFVYSVHADVVDSAGETRSEEIRLSVGYTALSATLTADPWLTSQSDTELQIRTTTLDNEPQSASGIVTVHALQQPARVGRSSLQRFGGRVSSDNQADKPDPGNPNSWPIGDVVFESDFETDSSGSVRVATRLPTGMYRAKLTTQDRFGKRVTAEHPLRVIDPESKRLSLKVPHLLTAPSWTLQPGDEFNAVWGSGYETARAFVEIESRGKVLQSYWTPVGETQSVIRHPVSEKSRGGMTVRTTMIHDNRAYLESRKVAVPWTNKELSLTWERFVSKLAPGEKETWTAVIRGSDAEARVAELVATLYDASLDAYQAHDWAQGFRVFRKEQSRLSSQFHNQSQYLRPIWHAWRIEQRDPSLRYRYFPPSLESHRGGEPEMMMMMDGMMEGAPRAQNGLALGRRSKGVRADVTSAFDRFANVGADIGGPSGTGTTLDWDQVPTRKNLHETAFFFPQLVSDKDGVVRLTFTMPETLTEWKFMGFAHDNRLRSGLLTDTVVTSKDLMVQPNPPRFLREGDQIEFTVKVSNQSPTHQSGPVQLSLSDARTGESVDREVHNVNRERLFDLAAGESTSLKWKLVIPDGLGFLTYKAVGVSGRLSDGEEGFLPVLSRRTLVTESLSLPIRGKGRKKFDFESLRRSAESSTLQSQLLDVQMVSNPSWCAVMALPYLMEYPHECAEQSFNRLYSNSLARTIANSDHEIRRIFDLWAATAAPDSPLHQNEEFKALELEETPWVRQAESEAQSRRQIGVLFDDNRLNDECEEIARQLSQSQLSNGAWSWFPGGRANDYITLYIAAGFGRLHHLGADVDLTAAKKSLTYLDQWAKKIYRRIKSEDRGQVHLSTAIAFYLYGRSFYLKDVPIADEHREAHAYWVSQAERHWLQLGARQSQAHLAIALNRLGNRGVAKSIMDSLKERSVHNDDMGVFWRDSEASWWWHQAPIETQAMMIEAFDEVADDQAMVEGCKVWLLKQKQTQDWRTTKATADAVYSLLLRGRDLLASDQLVAVTLGGETIAPDSVEAGTGFFEQRFVGDQIRPEQSEVVVDKLDEGVAWGSIHWQYLEDVSKIEPYQGTPLSITKQLYVKVDTDAGPKLQRVKGAVSVGDELVARVILKTDRDMEYVHLKDQRGSGTEPVNVLSRYRYQDGLAYYESTKDTASHFFIDYLPKGTYVFEYSTRVQLRGAYQSGIATAQCMYAPEFNTHSESILLEVN